MKLRDDEMLSLDEIRRRLKDRKLRVVAERIGLSYPTLKRISTGGHDNFNVRTLKKISKYFESEFESKNENDN